MRQAPWVTTMPGLARRERVEAVEECGQHAGAHLGGRLLAVDQQALVVDQPGGVLARVTSANSARVRPDRTPTSYSRSRASVSISRPVASATYAAVSRARARSLDHRRAGFSAAT